MQRSSAWLAFGMFPLIFLLTNKIFLPPTRAVLKHFLLSIWHIILGRQLSHLWQFLHYADSIWLLTVAFVLFSKQPPAESEFVDRWLTLRTTEEGLLSHRMSSLAHVFVWLTLNITRPNDCTHVNPVFVADTLSQMKKWAKSSQEDKLARQAYSFFSFKFKKANKKNGVKFFY